MAAVDVVVVSYRSAERLRACVGNFAGLLGVNVVVVDNASNDGSLESVAGLDVTRIQIGWNSGFAHATNVGVRAGTAPFVLLLNPDASIDESSLSVLVAELEESPGAGIVAPKIVAPGGALHHSLRRFPRLRSSWSQALFMHRLFPRSLWTDEVIRREEVYGQPCTPEWVSGACLLVRRSLLERFGGLDERFFLFCEDTDLCLRTWQAGYEVRYQPKAVAVHEGGASAGPATTLPLALESKLRYTQKHRSRGTAWLERLAIGVGAITHMLVGRRDAAGAHARSLRVVLTRLSHQT